MRLFPVLSRSRCRYPTKKGLESTSWSKSGAESGYLLQTTMKPLVDTSALVREWAKSKSDSLATRGFEGSFDYLCNAGLQPCFACSIARKENRFI